MSHTFLSDCLKVSSEIFIPVGHSEGQQHEIGGRNDGDGAGDRLTQAAAQRMQISTCEICIYECINILGSLSANDWDFFK